MAEERAIFERAIHVPTFSPVMCSMSDILQNRVTGQSLNVCSFLQIYPYTQINLYKDCTSSSAAAATVSKGRFFFYLQHHFL